MSSYNTSWWGRDGVEWSALRKLAPELSAGAQQWADERGNDKITVAVRGAIPYLLPFLYDLVEVVRQVAHDESEHTYGRIPSELTVGTRLADAEKRVSDLSLRIDTLNHDRNLAENRVNNLQAIVNEVQQTNQDLYLCIQEFERRFESEFSPRAAQHHTDALLGGP